MAYWGVAECLIDEIKWIRRCWI